MHGPSGLPDNSGMSSRLQNLPLIDLKLHWRNDFSALGPGFYTRLAPQPLTDPYWVGTSPEVARELGLDANWLSSPDLLAALTGNLPIAGSQPLASVYSGHQFGQWAGQLGDGRAILLGEVQTDAAALTGLEIQLKGSGRTPYSRMGDGRAVLRSSIREFLCSEAMHGLGIATTRALCVTGSDARVRREQIETAAVVTRVAPSFIRFGHFEHFSHHDLHDDLKTLADYVIDRYYPDCRLTENFGGNPYAAMLQRVSERTAALLAHWQAVGFCHGVMNTDNMSILGLTIDYGPFQFLDGFVPAHVCNHSDTQGRYAFNKQPSIAYWNLYALGQALLPLINEQDHAVAALESFKIDYANQYEARLRAKLGLIDTRPDDAALAQNLLQLLAQFGVDYTIFWRRLSQFVAGASNEPVRDLFADRSAPDLWLLRYSERLKTIPSGLSSDLMLKTNPKFVLRNHLGEMAIQKARHQDFSEVHTLQRLMASPFDEHPGFDAYADFPPHWAASIEISCSS